MGNGRNLSTNRKAPSVRRPVAARKIVATGTGGQRLVKPPIPAIASFWAGLDMSAKVSRR